MSFPIKSDRLALREFAASELLNIPHGVNLEDPLTWSLIPHDGEIAWDAVTKFVYIAYDGLWHIFPGGTGGNVCDVIVPCNIVMKKGSLDPAHGNIFKDGQRFMTTFPGTASQNLFLGTNAGNFTMDGVSNTGIGDSVLQNNTSGALNTAVGTGSMIANTFGVSNTAMGSLSLTSNTFGSGNTAIGNNTMTANTFGSANTAMGDSAMISNTTANFNAAFGTSSLADNTTGVSNAAFGASSMSQNITGTRNTGVGANVMFSNTTGTHNTGVGFNAIFTNGTGTGNTAIGYEALQNITTGSTNVAVGNLAGAGHTGSDSNNIDIANAGISGQSNTIRIGTIGVHATNFQAGIFTSAVAVSTVFVDASGQLGVAPSASKYKDNIKDMKDESSAILKLRPVTFTYKNDKSKTKQYGVLAEDIKEHVPSLAIYDNDGELEGVKSHELPAMLLNEFIKMTEHIQILEARIEELMRK